MSEDLDEEFAGIKYLDDFHEISYLDEALNEVSKIQNSLQATINQIQKLSAKHDASAKSFFFELTTPGMHHNNCSSAASKSDYLTWNIYNMIDETCQKHCLNLPQKHHNMHKINDDSTCSSSAIDIINHVLESSDDLEPTIVRVDGEKSNQQISIDDGAAGDGNISLFRTRSELMQTYNKIRMKTIKTKREIESALVIIDRSIAQYKCRAKESGNYFWIMKSSKKCPSIEGIVSKRCVSTASCKIKRKPSVLIALQRPASTSVIL